MLAGMPLRLVKGPFPRFAVAHLAAFVALASLGGGCKPKPGGRCSTGQTACQDGRTELFCLDGKFTEMTCAGPDGCVASGKQVDCDNTIANKGDGCSETEDLACTADKKGELRCRGNHFAVASTCRGPTGCFFTGNKLHCDTDVADSNDPCEEKDDLACALDKKALYKCDGQKYDLDSTCRGPKGCSIEGNNVSCDHHVAELGDACRFESSYACTGDRKALLACHSGKFKQEKKCSRPCAFTDRGDQTEFDCP
jgi:hypothetical protein